MSHRVARISARCLLLPALTTPLILGAGSAAGAQISGAARGYVGTRQNLALDGVAVPVKSVEGGGGYAAVVVGPVGVDHVPTKHIGGVEFDDFTIEVSPDMPKPLLDWVTAAWNRNYTRKNGSVVEVDANGKEVLHHDFTNAVVAETTIPTLDASSRNPGYITIVLSPELVRENKAGSAAAGGLVKTKDFTVNNFTLDIGGLGGKISKVESFTVKQKMTVTGTAETKTYQRDAGTTVYPDLTVTMSESGDDKWDAWFQDFVVKGNHGAGQEKPGKLTLLGPDMKPLATITLYNVGIYSFEPIALESGTVRRMQAKLYVDRMEFSLKP